MATKQIRTTAPAEGTASPQPAAWDWALDLGRQQLAVASLIVSRGIVG